MGGGAGRPRRAGGGAGWPFPLATLSRLIIGGGLALSRLIIGGALALAQLIIGGALVTEFGTELDAQCFLRERALCAILGATLILCVAKLTTRRIMAIHCCLSALNWQHRWMVSRNFSCDPAGGAGRLDKVKPKAEMKFPGGLAIGAICSTVQPL